MASSENVSDQADADTYSTHLPLGARPALVIIDMARAYFEPGSELYLDGESSLDSAARILDASRKAAIPVIHTRVSFDAEGINGGLFFRKVRGLRHFVEGSPLADAMPHVARRGDELEIAKQYASAFFGTSLASTLTTLGIDTLLIAGVSTSGCVRATAVDACQNGFVPVVIREAVADRNPAVHDASLFDIGAKYGEVISESAAVAYIEESR